MLKTWMFFFGSIKNSAGGVFIKGVILWDIPDTARFF